MTISFPEHLTLLDENAGAVTRLLGIHAKVAGTGAGRKHDVEVLNKSGIVLLAACWESYVEDLAQAAFDAFLKGAREPTAFPMRVLTLASKDLKDHQDGTKVWALAGLGWQAVLKKHRSKVLARFVQPLNTPKTKQVDELFESLIGAKRISAQWRWKGMSATKASAKLDRFIELRGAIAHRVKTDKPVLKYTLEDNTHFVKRLAGVLNNAVADHVMSRCGVDPWGRYTYVQ